VVGLSSQRSLRRAAKFKELLFLAVCGAPLRRLGGTLDRGFRLRLGFCS